MSNYTDGEMIATHIKCVVPQPDGSEGCGSSDGMTVYYYHQHDKKKHKLHCYACDQSKYLFENEFNALDIQALTPDNGRHKYAKRKNTMETPNQPENTQFLKGNPRADRGLTADTMKAYGVGTQALKRENQEIVARHIYPYYDASGNLIAQKVRCIFKSDGTPIPKGPETFRTIGEKDAWKKTTLFGQNIFPAGSARYITVTEGEVDAMSCYQMLGSKYPCVSISLGAQSARKVLENKAIYSYLDSFEFIVACFDTDEKGRKATEVLCDIFPHKAKVVPMSFKDANEYLMADKAQEFVKDAWWKAQPYRPDGLALSSEFIGDVVNGTVARGAVPYPFKGLNRTLFGMRQAELTTWAAGTGSGKSTVLRHLARYIKDVQQGKRIGMLMLEESPNKTATGLVGMELKKPLLLYDLDQQLPPEERVLRNLTITKEERERAAQKVLGDDRFVIMKNSFQGTDLDNIIRKVRQMNKVYECDHIILDHISIIVSGQDQGDERKALDAITTGLRRLTEETGINLHLVTHLKRPDGTGFEDGREISLSDIRGTGAIAQLSDNVVGLERNQQHEDPFLRNVIRFRCLKCRVTGLTGIAGYAYYNHETGCIEPITDEEYASRSEHFEQQKQARDERQQNVRNNVDFPQQM